MRSKRLQLFLFSLVMSLTVLAQGKSVIIKGEIYDKDFGDPIEQATVQLLTSSDSTFIKGVTSLQKGRFEIKDVSRANYILKISYIGYKTYYRDLKRSELKETTSLGKIELVTDAILLEGAEVTAEAPQVTVSADTLIFNSSAYRVPQNAMLEELVKKLPGAEVDADGKITINGKEISKIMVDGKEFFAKDPDVAMKNLPVDIIDRVKSYDKKSDQARITGIDDGNEETVLDLSVKKGMNKGWFGNLDVGVGNHSRYTAKGMINRFSDGDQLTGLVNFNNVRDASIGGGRGRFRNNGIEVAKSGGANFSITRKKYEVGGNVNVNDNERDLQSKTTSETFLQDESSYSKGFSNSINRNKGVRADFRLEWKPDTLTNLLMIPYINYSRTRSHSFGESLTATNDDFDNWQNMIDNGEAINTNESNSSSKGDSFSVGSNFMFHRKLNDKGRNIVVDFNFGVGNNDNNSESYSLIEYLKKGTKNERDLLTQNDNNNYNYRIKATYSEPIFTNRFLQFGYSYERRYNKTDRKTFDILGIEEGDDLDDFFDKDLSRFARNYYDNHEMYVNLNTVREKYTYNIGFTVQPQRNKMEYEQGEHMIDTTRNVVNFTPTFDFRYRFNKQSQLRITYRGNTSQPSMTDLLPIRDITNPLNIREGNPGLKPSYTNFMMLFYNAYFQESQRSIMTHLFFRNTLNSVSSKVIYDPTTGGRTTRPENINGNWNLSAAVMFNTPFKNKKFTFSSASRGRFNNIVGYMSLDPKEEAKKNKTRNLSLNQHLRFNYRDDWFEAGLNGGIGYSKVKNTMQPQSNRETYDYDFGISSNIELPWDMSFSTDGTYSIKNGYSQGLDRNEFIWNAQVSKSFLKQKQATISFQFFDILKQQSNLSRSISASMRSDVEYNEISSFFMVHFVYKLNTFGGSKGGDSSRGRGGHRGMGRRMHRM